MDHWRLRQIHLDFHTSPRIADVGAEFDAEDFARTLDDARVAWVTLFAKCHHGMCYYPSAVGPVHPGLSFDLLGAQIEACRRRKIVTPAYISVRVDQHMAEKRPEWVVRLADGRLWGPTPTEASWYQICLNRREYIDYVEAMTEEVLTRYGVDGIFYDMCYPPPDPGCFCRECVGRLERAGADRADAPAHRRQTVEIAWGYMDRLREAIRKIRPGASVFFNGRVGPEIGREIDRYTHLEIEALPTGGWGYHFFPFWSRFCGRFGLPMQGMTGRFHKSWADFGGLKTVDQLRFEAGTILAGGAAVNIGDQLHPRGRLDRGAYAAIGEVFADVEKKEPWCVGARAVPEIAVLYLPARAGEPLARGAKPAEGAARMLLELKHQFAVETADGDLNRYRLLILPDEGAVDGALAGKLRAFLDAGGSILSTHRAGLDPETGRFAVPGLGVSFERENPFQPSFIRLSGPLAAGLPEEDFVLYGAGSLVAPEAGAETFGETIGSYFNRDYNHFTSHYHSPADRSLGRPFGVRAGRTLYLAGSLFGGYVEHGYLAYKAIAANAIALLLPDPLVRSTAPAGMEITLMRQEAAGGRLVVHLVNYQPQRRHTAVEYIDTVWPVSGVSVAVRTERRPSKVYCAPGGPDLPVEWKDGYARVEVPEVRVHGMVVFEP